MQATCMQACGLRNLSFRGELFDRGGVGRIAGGGMLTFASASFSSCSSGLVTLEKSLWIRISSKARIRAMAATLLGHPCVHVISSLQIQESSTKQKQTLKRVQHQCFPPSLLPVWVLAIY